MMLNQFLRYRTANDSQFIDFFVKFFDPHSSTVADTEVERIIDLLFGPEKVSKNEKVDPDEPPSVASVSGTFK